MCHRIRIIAHIRGKLFDWIAGGFPNALDSCLAVSVEDSAIFGKGELFGGVFCGLPIGIFGATLNVIDSSMNCVSGTMRSGVASLLTRPRP